MWEGSSTRHCSLHFKGNFSAVKKTSTLAASPIRGVPSCYGWHVYPSFSVFTELRMFRIVVSPFNRWSICLYLREKKSTVKAGEHSKSRSAVEADASPQLYTRVHTPTLKITLPCPPLLGHFLGFYWLWSSGCCSPSPVFAGP